MWVRSGSVSIARSAAPVALVTIAALPVILVAGATPVSLVAWIAAAPEVVVATAPIPVATPARIPKLARAPVINRRRSGGLGLGDLSRPQTREPQTGGQYER